MEDCSGASAGVVRKLLNDFPDKLSPEILEELTQFLDEASRFRLAMPGKYARHYNGSHYFFNNDDMVKKTDDYYVLVYGFQPGQRIRKCPDYGGSF